MIEYDFAWGCVLGYESDDFADVILAFVRGILTDFN